MDQITLVGPKLEAGSRVVSRHVAKGNPLDVAFWANPQDSDYWYLYILSPEYKALGPTESYRRVASTLSELNEKAVRLSEIRIVGPDDPLASEVLHLNKHHPLTYSSWVTILGPTNNDGVYVYPPSLVQSATAKSTRHSELS